MATLEMQKNRMAVHKKETHFNLTILCKERAMSQDLYRQIFNENGLEKPKQSVCNHLYYYLICIIDSQASAALTWPLYDSKTERAYRNEIANFIADYSNRGLLDPVRSSYLVNPGCYKVTILTYQLTVLAVHQVLRTKMKANRNEIYCIVTDKYNNKETIDPAIEQVALALNTKITNYLNKKNKITEYAELLQKKITAMESKLVSVNAQKYINNLVDGYIKKHELDEETKRDIIQIKDFNEPSVFLEAWLSQLDGEIDKMESKWTEKMTPFIETCSNTQAYTGALIARYTGEAEKSTYMVEYNHKTDEICTKDLQSQVNSEQRYILKNIIKDGVLSFPNLIRGFVVAISYIMNSDVIDDDFYKFNEYLDGGKRNYKEVANAMRQLVERLRNAETRLQTSPIRDQSTISMVELPEIPVLPDLSDLQCIKELGCVNNLEPFTPLNMSKHQFNLRHRTTMENFARPHSKSLLITPFCHAPRDDFIKTLISCRVSSYDHQNVTQNTNRLSLASEQPRVNETIAECSTGFSKDQIQRLLSTKKSSSSKKFKHKMVRPNINIKKGGLFNESINIKKSRFLNESNSSNESNGLFRSYSSPNLYENREKKSTSTMRRRKLSIMPEDSPKSLNMSGIIALEKDSYVGANHFDSTVKSDIKIVITPGSNEQFHSTIRSDIEVKEKIIDISKIHQEEKTETPKNSTNLIRKTSSLEKIINRFKKVRANVISDETLNECEFNTIAEEKENLKVEVFTANRVLLPDLLSPSCSGLNRKSIDYLDQTYMDIDERVARKPRESLGTALGVDQTFLDQYDLVD